MVGEIRSLKSSKVGLSVTNLLERALDLLLLTPTSHTHTRLTFPTLASRKMETQTLLTTDPEITEREMLVSSRRHNVRLFRAALAGLLLFAALAMFMVAQYHHSGMYVDVSSPDARRRLAPLAHALFGAAPAVRRLRSV